MNYATVGELKKAIADVPDETLVLIPDGNHMLYRAHGKFTTAIQDSKNAWTEDYGEELMPASIYGEKIPVFIVRM